MELLDELHDDELLELDDDDDDDDDIDTEDCTVTALFFKPISANNNAYISCDALDHVMDAAPVFVMYWKLLRYVLVDIWAEELYSLRTVVVAGLPTTFTLSRMNCMNATMMYGKVCVPVIPLSAVMPSDARYDCNWDLIVASVTFTSMDAVIPVLPVIVVVTVAVIAGTVQTLADSAFVFPTLNPAGNA